MTLPSGTITFLFTDIEGSTKLWEEHPDAMRVALARHDALLRQAIEVNNGFVFKTIGDAFCAAFATAPDALAAALAAQVALHAELWPEAVSLRVRMALHTGAAELRDNDYFGQPLNRVARLLSAGHGGQTLLSDVAHELTRDTLPASVSLLPLGDHRLRDLGRPEPVFQLLHAALPAAFAPLKSLNNPILPNNLPQQVTSFIGREKEIEAVKSLLHKTRLLTLTGSGGAGKTRLSLQVAADVLETYPDGAWLVELASLADPAFVAQTVASALGVREEPGKPLAQTLVEFLKAKRLLLVLDNCEHVLDACSRLADTLLRSCPNVTILASSREGLGIAGETVYGVPSLSLPDLKQTATVESVTLYEAVRLFVDRAQAALPAFVVTNQNAPALASLCHRLDGIPLALELAAARVRSLSVEEINNKLDNRFRLLTGGSRAALPRQQTLRALIDWSYDLLNDQEKTMLCRVSVFAGGWTLEAAEQVAAGASETGEAIEDWEMLDLLTSLADKSLVVTEQEQGQTRYRLLETVRQYARDRLAESGEGVAVRARHGDYFVTLAEEINPKLEGSEQAQWYGVLETEHDNLRQALALYAEDAGEYAVAGEKGLRLGSALTPFWAAHGHLSEGRDHLRAALAHGRGQEPTTARGAALNAVGRLTSLQGDHAEAKLLFEESLALYRELGDKKGIAPCLNNLGLMAWRQGDYAGARALYEEGLLMERELGRKKSIANCLSNLAGLAFAEGDYGGARVLCEESLTLLRELTDRYGIADCLYNMGALAKLQGDYAGARVLIRESLTIVSESGYRMLIAYTLEALASLAGIEAQEARGVRLWAAAATLRETLGAPLPPSNQEEQEHERREAGEKLGEDAFALAWTEGRAMTLEQAVAYALEKGTP